MAIYCESDETLREGTPIMIRSATSGDARELMRFQRRIVAESEYLVRTPGELERGIRSQRKFIRDIRHAPDRLYLLAIEAGEIIGTLETSGSPFRRLAHGISFAVTVARQHQRRGVGLTLVKSLIAWAQSRPSIERIELHVHSENLGARKLYEKAGFDVEGIRRKAVKYDDGRYMDDIIMARLLVKDRCAGSDPETDMFA